VSKILLYIAQSESGLKPFKHLKAQCLLHGTSLHMAGLWYCSPRCNLYLQLQHLSLLIIFISQFLYHFPLTCAPNTNTSFFPPITRDSTIVCESQEANERMN